MGRVLPILFNTEMVRAILDGRKAETRRVIKPRYRFDEYGFRIVSNNATHQKYIEKTDENEIGFDPPRYINPPCQPGDILYVMETWQFLYELDGNEQIIEDTGRYYYAATDTLPFNEYVDSRGIRRFSIPWHPSIHMPKEVARIFLRVTDVRVERLQDITEEQATKEGCINNIGFIHSPDNEYDSIYTAKEQFITIWNSTTQKKDLDKYGWDANPWVWVIEFERCEKPESEG